MRMTDRCSHTTICKDGYQVSDLNFQLQLWERLTGSIIRMYLQVYLPDRKDLEHEVT